MQGLGLSASGVEESPATCQSLPDRSVLRTGLGDAVFGFLFWILEG